MATVRFSRSAETDILEITTYTLGTWGAAQAVTYSRELKERCQIIADNAVLDRPCTDILPGLQRDHFGRHVIYFWREETSILISRILHQRMSPTNHIQDARNR